MKRNLNNLRAEGQKALLNNHAFDIKASECNELKAVYDREREQIGEGGALFNLLGAAYQIGVGNGIRLQKRKGVKA